jgi:hypothetical protein
MSDGLSRECKKLRERLPEYAEGKLGGRLRARMERHLAQCARCAAEVEEIRAVIEAVRAVPSEAVPEHLVARVRRAVHERASAPPAPGQLWTRVAVPVAALTALIAIGFALRSPSYRGAAPAKALKSEAAMRERPLAPPVPGRARPSRPPTIEIAEAPQPEVAWQADESEWMARGRDEAATADAATEAPAEREPPAAPAPSEAPPVAREGAPATLDAAKSVAPPAPVLAPDYHRGGAAQARPRSGGMTRGAKRAQPYALPGPAEEKARAGGAEGFAAGGAGREEEAPPPPFGAVAALHGIEGHRGVALHLGFDRPLAEEIAVTLGGPGERRLLYRGPSGEAQPIVLPAEGLGPGPAAVPVTIESQVGRRDYTLFVPTMARLGESAPSAPVGRFDDEPVFKVLADFSALTGIVVLAEEPLSATFAGQIPPGPPAASLESMAGSMGFEVKREGDLVLTLTHPR